MLLYCVYLDRKLVNSSALIRQMATPQV